MLKNRFLWRVGNINHISVISERQEACQVNACFCILFQGDSDLSSVTWKTGSEVGRVLQNNLSWRMAGKSDCPESTDLERFFIAFQSGCVWASKIRESSSDGNGYNLIQTAIKGIVCFWVSWEIKKTNKAIKGKISSKNEERTLINSLYAALLWNFEFNFRVHSTVGEVLRGGQSLSTSRVLLAQGSALEDVSTSVKYTGT